jgi:uncharacterized protein (DUF433 family)
MRYEYANRDATDWPFANSWRRKPSPVLAGQGGRRAVARGPILRYTHVEITALRSKTILGLDRITADPDLLGGKACIRGMRISVSLILNLVANGLSGAAFIEEYPDLEAADIQQALQYAAWAA